MENSVKQEREAALKLHDLYCELQSGLEARLRKDSVDRNNLGEKLHLIQQNEIRATKFLNNSFAPVQGEFLRVLCNYAEPLLYSQICIALNQLKASKKAALCIYSKEVIRTCYDIQEAYLPWMGKTKITDFAQRFNEHAEIVARVLLWSHDGFEALKDVQSRDAILVSLLNEELHTQTSASLNSSKPEDAQKKYDEIKNLYPGLRASFNNNEELAGALGVCRHTLTAVLKQVSVSQDSLDTMLAKARQIAGRKSVAAAPKKIESQNTPSKAKSEHTVQQAKTAKAARDSEPASAIPMKDPLRLLGALLSALRGTADAVAELISQTGVELRPHDRMALAQIVNQLVSSGRLDQEIIEEAWEGHPMDDRTAQTLKSLFLSK